MTNLTPNPETAQSMSGKLVIRPQAEAEMAEAYDWYEARVPGLGSEFLLAVDAGEPGNTQTDAGNPLRSLCFLL